MGLWPGTLQQYIFPKYKKPTPIALHITTVHLPKIQKAHSYCPAHNNSTSSQNTKSPLLWPGTWEWAFCILGRCTVVMCRAIGVGFLYFGKMYCCYVLGHRSGLFVFWEDVLLLCAGRQERLFVFWED